nr:putative ribonuclease H-like domain-containing protein [Tanacetum cinerariifolium]
MKSNPSMEAIEGNKLDKRGIVIRNKARLVDQGHTQEEGIDYDEVFAPVARIEAIRLFLAYASFKDFVVYQMDVKSAFLYGKIKKEVYFCQPPGFEDPDFPDRVYKVEKTLYGLHQAPRAWYETLSTYLLDNRYLKGQPKLGLWYPKDLPFDLVAYTDSDYARASLDRKSTIGGCQFLREGCLEWNGKAAKDEISTSAHNLNVSAVKHKLTTAGDVYTSCIEQFWTTKKAKNINGEAQIHANVDGKKVIISEASIRRDLRMDNHTRNYVIPSHTKKVFGNMRRVGNNFSGKITPLFPTMMVQAQEEIEHVADKAVNEEMDDSLEKATTIATSLDAEQDRGNISKTQSKATPPSSLETSSGGGPRRPGTMGDTITHTRSENVSKFSNDPLLVRVNTPQSGEDSLKLTEVMELCTNLQQRVFDLETIKTSQAQEITSLKKRVKRLEKKRRSRTHGLKRLYKVGLSARVESSADEESLDKDIFSVNDQDDTSMFDVVNDLQGEEVVVEKEVVGKDVSAVKEVNAASIATSVTATTTTAATTPTISMDEITLAKALIEIKISRPKAKGIVMQEPSETPTPTPISSSQQPSKLTERLQAEEQEQLTDAEKAKLFMEFMEKKRKLFAAKRTTEKRNKPPTKAQQRSIMSTYLKNMNEWKTKGLKNKSFADIQDLFNKAMKKVNMFVNMDTEVVESSKKTKDIAQEGSSKRAGDQLEQ